MSHPFEPAVHYFVVGYFIRPLFVTRQPYSIGPHHVHTMSWTAFEEMVQGRCLVLDDTANKGLKNSKNKLFCIF